MNKWDQLTHVRLGKQKKKENLFFFARSMYTITTTIWLNRFKSQLKVYLRNNESNTTTVKVVSPGNPTLVPCAYSNTSHQYATNDVQTKKDMLFNVRWFLVKWKNICQAQTVPFWIWSSLIQYIYKKKSTRSPLYLDQHQIGFTHWYQTSKYTCFIFHQDQCIMVNLQKLQKHPISQS